MDSLKNSRILLTGGAGFVGSYIIDQLLQEPVKEIIVIDNFVRGSRKNLERALQDKRVHLTEGDIRDREGLDHLFEGIDYCFHLAALRITHSAAEPRHALEVMTTGDGGMMTTNNAQFDQKLRLLRNHGMNISGAERLKAKKFILEQYLMTAFNYRMTDIQAAVGIAQLEKVPEFIKQRRKIGGYYRKYFAEIDWLELPFEPDYARANWQSYPIRLLKNAPLGQTELMHYLFENGVATIPGVMNAHQESPYLAAQYSLKHSEEARKEAVIFPFYVGLAEQDIKKMSEILKRLETRQGLTSSKH
jgi:hypothetical protein